MSLPTQGPVQERSGDEKTEKAYVPPSQVLSKTVPVRNVTVRVCGLRSDSTKHCGDGISKAPGTASRASVLAWGPGMASQLG